MSTLDKNLLLEMFRKMEEIRRMDLKIAQLVTLLGDLIDTQTDPTIAPYAKTGEVTLRLSTIIPKLLD